MAYSRTKDPNGLKVLSPTPYVRNVVYPQVKQETQLGSDVSREVQPGDSYVPLELGCEQRIPSVQHDLLGHVVAPLFATLLSQPPVEPPLADALAQTPPQTSLPYGFANPTAQTLPPVDSAAQTLPPSQPVDPAEQILPPSAPVDPAAQILPPSEPADPAAQTLPHAVPVPGGPVPQTLPPPEPAVIVVPKKGKTRKKAKRRKKPPQEAKQERVRQAALHPACGPSGMRNRGNQCYMLASLQCLYVLPHVQSVFLDSKFNPDTLELDLKRAYGVTSMSGSRRQVSRKVRGVFRDLRLLMVAMESRRPTSSDAVRSLIEVLGFRHSVQEDATEILFRLCSVLECAEQFSVQNPLWTGFSTVTNGKTEAPDMCCSIPCWSGEGLLAEKVAAFAQQSCHLFDRDANGVEVKVGQMVMEMTSVPSILQVSLLRVERTPDLVQKKLAFTCPFEQTLCLRVGQRRHLFVLLGFVCHLGPSLEHGHYVAYTREHDTWYRVSDSTRERMCWPHVVADSNVDQVFKTAVLFFYQKVAEPDPGLSALAVRGPFFAKGLDHGKAQTNCSARLPGTGVGAWLDDDLVWTVLSLWNQQLRGSFSFSPWLISRLLIDPEGAHSKSWFSNHTRAPFSSMSTLIFPVCRDEHWVLFSADLQSRTIHCFDSLSLFYDTEFGDSVSGALEAYIFHEAERQKSPMPTTPFRRQNHACPQQDNYWDCGMYMLSFAKVLLWNGHTEQSLLSVSGLGHSLRHAMPAIRQSYLLALTATFSSAAGFLAD